MKRYSIIQEQMDKCFVCKKTNNLHIHEIFFGTANRQLSIKYGCCVCLCAEHHNMSNYSAHRNRDFDLYLKQLAQSRFKEVYSDLDFVQIFHKNFLGGNENE